MPSLRTYWTVAPRRARFLLLCAGLYVSVYVASFLGLSFVSGWGVWLTLPCFPLLALGFAERRRARPRTETVDLDTWRAAADPACSLAAKPGPLALPVPLRWAVALSLLAVLAGWLELGIRGEHVAGPPTRIFAAMAVLLGILFARDALRRDWPAWQARQARAKAPGPAA